MRSHTFDDWVGAQSISSVFCSCILMETIVLRDMNFSCSRRLAEKMPQNTSQFNGYNCMWSNKVNICVRLSFVNVPFVNISVFSCSVDILDLNCWVQVTWSYNQSESIVCVLETCLIVGLLPLLIILMKSPLSLISCSNDLMLNNRVFESTNSIFQN